MKKAFIRAISLLSAAVLLVLTAVISFASAAPGDVNGDNVVNSKDVILTKLHINGDAQIDAYAADINGDSLVDSEDVKDIAQIVLDTTHICSGSNGICDTCQRELAPTKGIEYTLSGDGTSCTITGMDTSESTDVIIPSSYNGVPVTSIAKNAFFKSDITSVVIPDSVTSIGKSAFDSCYSLSGELVIPDSVTSIGTFAFADCYRLTSVTIEDGVTSIASGAFYGCDGLTEILIPASVTNIGLYPFANCDSLQTITVDENNTVYHSENNCLIKTSEKSLVTGIAGSVIPTDGSVTQIARYAFYSCDALTEITIPDTITTIGGHAFAHCDGLTSVIIPASVTSIESYAFNNSDNLMSITVDENNTKYHSDGNCMIETDTKILVLGCSGSTIPTDGSVTKIAQYAFYGYGNLTSITIPASVTVIDPYAFYVCENLASVTFENTDGWYLTTSAGATSGTAVDVIDPAVNAENLVTTYYENYWKK